MNDSMNAWLNTLQAHIEAVERPGQKLAALQNLPDGMPAQRLTALLDACELLQLDLSQPSPARTRAVRMTAMMSASQGDAQATLENLVNGILAAIGKLTAEGAQDPRRPVLVTTGLPPKAFAADASKNVHLDPSVLPADHPVFKLLDQADLHDGRLVLGPGAVGLGGMITTTPRPWYFCSDVAARTKARSCPLKAARAADLADRERRAAETEAERRATPAARLAHAERKIAELESQLAGQRN